MTDFTALGLPSDLPEIAAPNLLGIGAENSNPPAVLSPKEKAAIVLRVLLADGGQLRLDELPHNTQVEMAKSLAGVSRVSKQVELQVIAEFLKELETGGTFSPSGLHGAISLLDGLISPDAVRELTNGRPAPMRADPWPKLSDIEPPKFAALLATESSEVTAICLSKLPGKLAAQILAELPGPAARRAAYMVSKVESAKPETVREIGRAILRQFSSEPKSAFANKPAELVGSMLLSAGAQTRDEILDGLKSDDAEFAERVREEIFVFADIYTRIEPTSIPRILREVEAAKLLLALKYSEDQGGDDAQSAEYILSNMSKRLAESLREEIAELAKVKSDEGEAAQSEVIDAIRQLESDGEITLIIPEPEDGA